MLIKLTDQHFINDERIEYIYYVTRDDMRSTEMPVLEVYFIGDDKPTRFYGKAAEAAYKTLCKFAFDPYKLEEAMCSANMKLGKLSTQPR